MAGFITIPEGDLHWTVKRVYATLRVKRWTYDQLHKASGVSVNTFRGWRLGAKPSMEILERVYRALGYAIIVVPTSSVPAVDALVRGTKPPPEPKPEGKPKLRIVVS